MELLYTKQFKRIILENYSKDVIIIRPFGDVHCDSEAFDYDRWHLTLNHWKRTDTSNTYYIGMGDFMDFMSIGETKSMNSIKDKLHLDTKKTFDKVALKQVKDFAKDIEFMRCKILGFIDGNHSYTFLDTKTSTQLLSEMFNTEYLGWLTYFRLGVSRNKNTNGTYNYDIVACHGRAGGKLIGTSVNQVDEVKRVFPAADLYLFAHDHQRFAVPTASLIASSEGSRYKIKQKEQYLCRTGSFLKSYEPNKQGYVIGTLRRPASLGTIEIHIRMMRKQSITEKEEVFFITEVLT